jgi:hypothetical protein
MWRASLAIAVLLGTAQSVAAAQADPFASLGTSFWRPAASDFGPDAAVMISSNSLTVKVPCFLASNLFHGNEGRPHFIGLDEYHYRTTPACAPLKPAFDTAENHLQRMTSFHLNSGNLVLRDANDREIVSLTPIIPDGVEFRWWAITGYRSGGKLVKQFSRYGLKPMILFFNGEILGTPGVGGFSGTYSKKGGYLSISVEMACSVDCLGDLSERTKPQKEAILRALEFDLHPNAKGRDQFLLYDKHGHVQIELTLMKENP